MFQSRFETREVVKNFEFAAAVDEIRRYLTEGFRSAHLFTTAGELQLKIGKRNSHLSAGKTAPAGQVSTAHDREKQTLIDPSAFYLKALGISDDNGRIKPSQQDKWRQITKFVEILASLVDASPIREKRDLKIVDMGSGKGYLTFAAYDYFANVRKGHIPQGEGDPSQEAGISNSRSVQMTGIEARPELVELCNGIAAAGGFEGLRFIQGQIVDLAPEDVDIVIALHACDTATDDALYKGVLAKAAIIVAAPCCHKELRPQIKPPEPLAGILKHGIMLERTAETLTDGLRALLLEREGYATKLFEFVPTQHTPKNNMLTAIREHRPSKTAARQIDEIRSQFGIRSQHLEALLERRTNDPVNSH